MYACQRVDSLFKSQRTYFYDLWSRYQYGPFLRLLISWYSGQSCSILWAGVISSVFFVTNGVRQGGVLSPLLFNLYIDELSLALNCINAGCCLGNHLLYADDVVLFAPSAKGLQALLDTCTCFAARHDIFFNTRKSQVLVVPGRNMPTAKPCFRLCNSAMDFTDQYKYLGHILLMTCVMMLTFLDKHVRYMLELTCCCASSLRPRQLQRLCCSTPFAAPFMGVSSGLILSEPFRRLHVAFNNALRLLLKMPTWCSASQLFVQHGAITFLAIIRKQQFSLLRSLCSCNNAVTQAFVSCDRFWCSPILEKWRSDLYV